MKKSNLLIVAVLAVLCLIGWLTLGSSNKAEGELSYDEYMEQADDYVERGLYQRAINSYSSAKKLDASEEVYLRIEAAYKLRYEEEPEATAEEYLNFLTEAVKAYPANKTFVDMYLIMQSDNAKKYDCLLNAVSNGYDNEENREKLRTLRYSYSLRRDSFTELVPSVSGYFTIAENGSRNGYSLDGGRMLDKTFSYVSCPNTYGVLVTVADDSRLTDGNKMVYGIFPGEVTDASLFADGLIAACIDGKYGYYDEFAVLKFGEYEAAGTFQNGKAAVKEAGSWKLIDTSGEELSDEFDEIVMNSAGYYLIGEAMLAKEDGKWGIYDAEGKLKCELDCDETDVMTADGVIAVRKGDKWGFADLEGNIKLAAEYEAAHSYSNGVAAVKKDGKWGFIDPEGMLVIDYVFSDALYMTDEGVCPVRTDLPSEDGEETTDDTEESAEQFPMWRLLEFNIGLRKD